MQTATKVDEAEIVPHEPAYQAPAVVDQQAAMLSMIERVAMNPDLPIERLTQLLDMKERIDTLSREERAREAQAAYYRAMAECQAELKVKVAFVRKNKTNSQTHSRYADLAAISEVCDPIIHAHGFTTSFQPGGATEGGEKVKWTIAHTAGHIERGEAVLSVDDKGPKGEVNKTKIHGFGSTMSYGRRYLKLMLWDIATGDDDDGNAAGARRDESKTIDADQYRNLRDLMERAKVDEAKFLAHLKVEDLHELPAAKYDAATTLLWQKIAQPVVKGQADAS